MYIPYCTCTYHTVHVHIILYMYIPYYTCTYHTVHAHTMLYMNISYCTCTYHTVHVHTILYMHISYCTCTYTILYITDHAVHAHTTLCMHIVIPYCNAHTLLYMYIPYCTCTYHTVIFDVTHNNDILMIITIPRGLIPWLPLTCYVLLYILFTFMFFKYFLHIVLILPHPSQKVVIEITHVYSSIVLIYRVCQKRKTF